MKKLTALLFVMGLFALTNVYAQNASLKGTVVDTTNKVNLQHAVVSLLRPKDSVLVKFVRTDQQGQFNFGNLPATKYIMIISYPDYADFVDDIDLSAQPQKTLGNIYVTTKAHLLEEVIVKQRISAIRMKGDTTEYRADSFYVGPNANVQDLLKRMPGIQVNSKGEISAQGQKVEKILVDGEEFFSDDPAVVTQNLRADAVEKVQVFDKKSDQAVFTGIDDGQTAKTINLQLKEDAKKGYFGKIEAGSDFDRYKYGKGMLNAFKGKRKLAAYITNDNTRFESLNWNERNNYGSNNTNMEVMDDGGIMMYSSGDEFSYGQGLPTSTTGGFLFSNKWNQDKHNINNSYQYNNLNVKGRTQTTTQTILPDTTFINTQDQNFVSDRRRNRINSKYDLRIDSTSTLKLSLTGSIVSNRNANSFLGKAISEDGQIINQSDRTTTNDGEDRNLLGSLQWQKRLKKKGRTLSFSGDFSVMDKTNDGFLFAKNDFYDKNGSLVRQDNLDQFKTNKEALSSVNGRLSYTEPLWKNTFMELNYRFAFNRNDAERNTLERNAPGGKYENMIDTLSNHFIYNSNNHTGGFTLRLNEKKFSLYGGASLGSVKFNLDDINKGTNRNISFTNFLPTAGITFNPKKQRRINLNYNGTTRNPSLQQIQPFIDNIDPLNITIGNPNLKQEFRHNFNMSFSDYKVLKSKNIYLSANFSTTNNAITNANFIDSIGRRINQAINVNGNYTGSMWSRYGFDLFPSYNLNFGLSPSVSRFVNFVNGLENISKNNSLGINLGISHWSEKKFNFYVSFDARYNHSSSSIRPNATTKYWSYTSWADLTLKLPAKFIFTTSSQINLYQRTSVFAGNSNVYIVNSSLGKTFGKSDKLEMKLAINDIFNQNQNIRRNISTNFITETIQQNIQRFWLLSIAYNFSKTENLLTDFKQIITMKNIFILLFLLSATTSFSQARFISSGRVEFERKYNQHSQLEGENEGPWIAEMKKIYPKMITDHYELRFNNERSVYRLLKENPDNKYLWMGKPSESDVTIKDINKGTISMQRDVFEQTYLIQDSLRQLEWRITDETRTIAGFECKKAVTKICDSVYVVAFYTDQIMVNSGPESFSGLPGMILGLAVPRLHTTWFATKVELVDPTPAQLSPSQKGKKASWTQLSTDLNKAMKDWGKEAARILWNSML